MLNRRDFLPKFALFGGFSLLSRSHMFGHRDPIIEENTDSWTTADGRTVRICDMTDDHLRNCIFYLNRRYSELKFRLNRVGWKRGEYYMIVATRQTDHDTIWKNVYEQGDNYKDLHKLRGVDIGMFPSLPDTVCEWEPRYLVMLKEATKRKLSWV